MRSNEDETVRAAAAAIRDAEALLIGAGAGMGVDSGLPDFRGPEGFWRAYPPFRERGLRFEDLANPVWFAHDPEQAWGFYGHRLQLYRRTVPHEGFAILLRWARRAPGKSFVFTSNVDGQFQKAGFGAEEILECHGSIHALQCSRPCSSATWSAGEVVLEIDEGTFRAAPPLPTCPRCGAVARPNILMFGDGRWVSDRSDEQERRYREWLRSVDGRRLVVIECGAGTAVPTVRWHCENVGGCLIRVNPREPSVPPGALSLASGAAEGLRRIAAVADGGS